MAIRLPERAPARTFAFVAAGEPLAATRAVRSAVPPIDLCVAAPSELARITALSAVAGRPVRVDFEPLLAGRRPDEDAIAWAAREADALLALYALDTRAALVVWDEVPTLAAKTPLVDEWWLLHRAEQIGLALPPP
jgi:hypothetical protein